MSDVTIIGAGLSGLSAANTIAQSSLETQTTVFESGQTAGGRMLDGRNSPDTDTECTENFNLGAVYFRKAVYTEAFKLIRELGVEENMQEVGKVSQGYIDRNGVLRSLDDFPMRRWTKFILGIKSIGAVICNGLEESRINISQTTVSEWVNRNFGNKASQEILDFLELCWRAYTYPGTDSMLAKEMLAHFRLLSKEGGGLSGIKIFPNGANQGFIKPWVQKLQNQGVQFQYGQKVVAVERARDPDLRNVVYFENGEYIQANGVIMTSGYGKIEGVLPKEAKFEWARYYQPIIRLELFQDSNLKDHQVVYIQNRGKQGEFFLDSIYNQTAFNPKKDSSNHMLAMLYIRVPPDFDGSVSEDKVSELLHQNCIGFRKIEFLGHHTWNTMPKHDPKTLQMIRDWQGIDNIFFAGDQSGYLGTIEAAITSGKKAAQMLIQQMQIDMGIEF